MIESALVYRIATVLFVAATLLSSGDPAPSYAQSEPTPHRAYLPAAMLRAPLALNPRPVGELAYGQDASVIALHEGYAFVGGSRALATYDIRDGERPLHLVGRLYLDALAAQLGLQAPTEDDEYGVSDLEVAGDELYMTLGRGGLVTLDIRQPRTPKLQGVTAVGRFAGSLDVVGDVAYVSARWQPEEYPEHWSAGALYAIDVSEPAAPRFLGRFVTEHYCEFPDLDVDGRHAYLAGTTCGLQVVDVSDPEHMHRVYGVDDDVGDALDVVTGDGHVYVGWGDGVGVSVYDIHDPSRVERVAHFDDYGQDVVIDDAVYDLELAGTTLYVSSDLSLAGETEVLDGIAVVDVSTPAAPQLRGLVVTPVDQAVAGAAGRLYVAGHSAGILVYDVADPVHPRLLDETLPLTSVRLIDVDRDRAYLVDPTTGLHVVDVSVPTDPRVLGSTRLVPLQARSRSPWPTGLAVSRRFAYIASGDQGLIIVDVADGAAPRVVRRLSVSGAAEGVTISERGRYLYLAQWITTAADDHGLLSAVDVSNPAEPRVVGQLRVPPSLSSIAAEGGYVHAMLSGGDIGDIGFRVYDVRDPARMREVGALALTEEPPSYQHVLLRQMAVEGTTAYLVDQKRRLYAIDVSDPGAPHVVGRAPGVGRWCMSVSDGLLISCDVGWLYLFDVSDPRRPRQVSAKWLEWGPEATQWEKADAVIENDTIFFRSNVAALSIFRTY